MGRLFVIVALMPLLSNLTCAQEVSGQLATRRTMWQEYLGQHKYIFRKNERGMFTSMDFFSANCQLHIVLTQRPKRRMFFKFVREGKELLILSGGIESVFRTADEKLYFAHFDPSNPGCTVSAYDLTNGKELWTVEDVGRLRQGGASGYSNQVLMRLSRVNEIPNESEGAALIITGHEGFGDYISILDRETGVLLARKVYETGFGPSSPAHEAIEETQSDSLP